MEKKGFNTADIARICLHSRETVKRWLDRGRIKGYRIGTSGHWRVLPKDLALFLKENNIPFPETGEAGIDLKALLDSQTAVTFCWEFNRNRKDHHIRPGVACEDCLIYKVKSINCYALREEVRHKKIYCGHSCEDCAYFHFQQEEIAPKI
jgi:hypothetical protein